MSEMSKEQFLAIRMKKVESLIVLYSVIEGLESEERDAISMLQRVRHDIYLASSYFDFILRANFPELMDLSAKELAFFEKKALEIKPDIHPKNFSIEVNKLLDLLKNSASNGKLRDYFMRYAFLLYESSWTIDMLYRMKTGGLTVVE